MTERDVPPKPHTVTIYDVARRAGVAPSTVSRTFSRPGRVNAVTAARVRRVAAEVGYRANPVARALSTARTNMIAVVILDIANPFYAEIVRGAQAAAAAAGYTVVLADAQESDWLERSTLERAVTAVDGIVLASSRMSDLAIRMISKQKPVVVLNRGVVDVPCVVTDNARGARLALEHLSGLGHEHVTYIAGPEASWADGMRWSSLRESAAKLSVRLRRLGPFAPDVRGGVQAAEQFVAQPTSAVVAYNDQLAIGLVRSLITRGIGVPRNVSVVGFDNIAAADLVTPGLTTVAAPLYAQGITATRHVLTMIEGGRDRTGQPAVLPVRLVVRGSTAAPHRSLDPPRPGRGVTTSSP
ncbi:LacI family transcriptional regulator [Parafrankia colletiae]|uniref:LacI family transcriptional regulator n=1 Tax=Parafrankia colletiae TaxID=573497 RepID=A0A1S1QW70_9ACTN|nr:LacI family DNA-binding transcriptional regulator [Parafrankia colletiae]MCK9899621.1 LacI family transcriptional regulator [Frankia sp. Cpl3]OHV37957.1 LacI family transcriptional regulator [Parafrankia colletiae]